MCDITHPALERVCYHTDVKEIAEAIGAKIKEHLQERFHVKLPNLQPPPILQIDQFTPQHNRQGALMYSKWHQQKKEQKPDITNTPKSILSRR